MKPLRPPIGINPSSLAPTLAKLAEVLEEENSALSSARPVAHAATAERKHQALRDILSLQKSLDIRAATMDHRDLLSRISSLLLKNARLLKMHIQAVGEVSDIIVMSMRAAESDGTYCRRQVRK